MLKAATFRTELVFITASLASYSFHACCYADPAVTVRVVVDISGSLSTDPSAIRTTGNPGLFPAPDLLGGSFAGQFAYSANSIGVIEPNNVVREFYLSSIRIHIRDKIGSIVHTIDHAPNPFKISDGHILFGLGPSFYTQEGHSFNTPTDIRFDLRSSSFLKSMVIPPSAVALNGAVPGAVFGYGPFIELDASENPFYGWDLPITSMSLSAREVPEPRTIALFAWIVAFSTCVRWRLGLITS